MTDYALIAVLFGSNIFWAYVCLKLTNRLMCRTFHEYVSAERKPAKRELKSVPDEIDEFAERQAEQLNAVMGTL